MQCFGGLFRPRTLQRDVSSNSDSPPPPLSTSGESSAATCSPASYVQLAQQHGTQTHQQYATACSTCADLPTASPSVSHPLGCTDSTVADQQRQAQHAAPGPAANTSTLGGSAAAQKVPDAPKTASKLNCRPAQKPELAEAALQSVPPVNAEHNRNGNKPRSALEAFTAFGCSADPPASPSVLHQAGLKLASLPDNRVTRHDHEEECGVHSGHLQALQQRDSLSKQASLEGRDPGLMAAEPNSSWDNIRPHASHNKDFLGQRKKDIRGSLDWDFQNDAPMVTTRRSKEYGGERPMMKRGVAAARSFSGSSDSSRV